MTAETWREQTCPDDAPDGRCWDCRAPSNRRHEPGCPTQRLPRYTGTRIYTCPECDGDVTPDGPSDYWCPPCGRCWSFTQVGAYEDGDRPDD
jgi:hypothetical protein